MATKQIKHPITLDELQMLFGKNRKILLKDHILKKQFSEYIGIEMPPSTIYFTSILCKKVYDIEEAWDLRYKEYRDNYKEYLLQCAIDRHKQNE